MNIVFDTYQTLALASFVLLLGFFLVKRIRVLQTFNIPEPVVGGFIVAIALTILYKVNGSISLRLMPLPRTPLIASVSSRIYDVGILLLYRFKCKLCSLN